ncbi:Pls/PosA family non-ribosomal peptide synthetase [Streptomyces manipurensis]|uniref:Pls/PosA family non-ribosomal peptide synthetase n=1 Tax=Streptomyces manipurensis TaxID=1077945 RepID=UPI003C6F9EB6
MYVPTGDPVRSESRTESCTADTATALAALLADVVGVDHVPGDSDFFRDLGADSMVMARFCARARKRPDLPPVSMKDVYRHPTADSLAAALTRDAPPSTSPQPPLPAVAPPPAERHTDPSPPRAPVRAGTARYLLCGTLQLLAFLAATYAAALAAAEGYEWAGAGTGVLDVYLRAVLVGAAGFAGLCLAPIVAKWTLIGRFTAEEFPVWTLRYVRWWLVRTLIRTGPARLFVASPLYPAYLRALGAKIGRDVAILSVHIPVCTDLLTIGDGTVIRKDVRFSCYRAHDGLLQTGPVTLGRNVLVGEQSVLDIHTAMGDGSQLGHASSLHTGQTVPADARRHGSPAEPTGTDFRTVGPAASSTARKLRYTTGQLLVLLLVSLPLATGALGILVAALPHLHAPFGADSAPAFTSGTFYLGALAASFVLFFGSALAGLLVQGLLPRLLRRGLKPDTVYPLHGRHHALQRAVTLLTNRRLYTTLFGDSSAIVPYLRYLGYDLGRVTQTGSNFGSEVKHDSPFLSSVGSGTMVADGLSLLNAEYSATSFRLTRVAVGAHSFLGNRIAYPAHARTGDNCLLATKVMVPVDGELRENTGLLGSPPFAIPRTVLRDTRFRELEGPGELPRRLAAKNRHNAVTAGLYLAARWTHLFLLTLLALGAKALHPTLGVSAIALAAVLALPCTVVLFVLVERASTGFKAQRPLYCSIYEPAFWRHERFWKMASLHHMRILDGTPFKNVVGRLQGARIGKRVFDDGCAFPERTLLAIGDDSTLNAGTVIQCHSQEDGAFKSDRTVIGDACTLGVGAFVHYGVTLADGAQLACDAFLMKGEQVPPGARWTGNPARPLTTG